MRRFNLAIAAFAIVAILGLAILPLAAVAGPPQCANERCAYAVPAYQVQTVAYAVPSTADGPTEFLAALNVARARYGRNPLAWDSTLAAYASRNTSSLADPRYRGHSPWSMAPGASQCQATARTYLGALSQWMDSPPHRAILLSARSTVGCSPCPSGMTANFR